MIQKEADKSASFVENTYHAGAGACELANDHLVWKWGKGDFQRKSLVKSLCGHLRENPNVGPEIFISYQQQS